MNFGISTAENGDVNGNQPLTPELIDTNGLREPERVRNTGRLSAEAGQREVKEKPLSERGICCISVVRLNLTLSRKNGLSSGLARRAPH